MHSEEVSSLVLTNSESNNTHNVGGVNVHYEKVSLQTRNNLRLQCHDCIFFFTSQYCARHKEKIV